MIHMDRCFACGRKLGSTKLIEADTLEDQRVFVGPECAKHIRTAGDRGWQPPRGGPRLYPLSDERRAYFDLRGM